MKRLVPWLALLGALTSPLVAQLSVPESGPTALNPRVQDFLRERGRKYGLALAADGGLVYEKADVGAGRTEAKPLEADVARKVLQLIARLPADDVDAAMAAALRTYIASRPEAAAMESRLFEKAADGREVLTALGRNVLMDILTAEDGKGYKPRAGGLGPRAVAPPNPLAKLSQPGLGGWGTGTPFDGSTPGMLQLSGFDWSALGSLAASGVDLSGFAVDKDRGSVRLLIAAPRAVAKDRLTVEDPSGEAPAIYNEAGLDPALMARHEARVVRAVDNLIAVDLPLSRATELGRGLASLGVDSRPARVIQQAASLAADAALRGPAWPDPLYNVLPLAFRPHEAGTADVSPANAASRDIMSIASLWGRGMTGKGAIVGIIDSGLDVKHPDFKGRVLSYVDLSGSGLKDTVAHGTHVAGSVGGDGAASSGKYKGMAPDTRFVIVKVFGDTGRTSEDTVLAGMKAMRSLPAEIRPQVVNMSLGGPGDADKDPISQLANEMMVKDNILMAIAAGNSGPNKGTVAAPGNARYVLTVTGVNKDKKFSFFPSRGPVTTSEGETFNKPDIATVAGDVSSAARRKAFWSRVIHPFGLDEPPANPSDPGCFYGPGVISARSSDDKDTGCALAGNPSYRFMTGTSMATPMAAGIAADAIGYMKEKGHVYKASEVKALMMETATDLHQPAEVQGSGLIDGEKLSRTLAERVQKGLPAGNIAYMLTTRLSRWDEFNMKQDARFEKTAIGLVDAKTSHLVNTDVDYDQAVGATRKAYDNLPWYTRASRRFRYWWNG